MKAEDFDEIRNVFNNLKVSTSDIKKFTQAELIQILFLTKILDEVENLKILLLPKN